MAPSTLATIYGCCGLFDLCSDNDLMSLSFEKSNKFLDWIGWELTDVCTIKKNFITYVRPEAVTGARSAGYISDHCGVSKGVDWGEADFVLDDWGILRRHGPERVATRINTRLCEAQPRYRLDGTPITSDIEYDMRLAVEAQLQDLRRMVVDGAKTTAGQFDGLESLVKTGYTDSKGRHVQAMDSVIIDMNATGMAASAGRTWNGAAIASTATFVDILLAAFRRIVDRIQLAPALSAQSLNVGDIVFVAPTHVIRALLDSYTFWSVMPGVQYNEVNLQNYEARTFRNSLMGGMFQAGQIYLDGFTIPMMAYDWGLLKGPTRADAYLLTGQVGSVKTLQGQLLDMRSVPAGYPEADYSYTDGGRLLTWLNRTQTCVTREVEMQPRLLSWAPWANVRFQDIDVAHIAPIISADPWDTSFFPNTSFISAACPA